MATNIKNILQKLNLTNILKLILGNNNVSQPRTEDRTKNLLIFLALLLAQPTIKVDYVKENNTEKNTFCLSTNKFTWLFEQLAHSLVFAITTIKRICEMDKEANKLIFNNSFVLGGVVGDQPHPVRDTIEGYVVILSLGHSDFFENESTNESVENVDWYRVKFTGELAVEALALSINTPIEIQGKFRQSTWRNKTYPNEKYFVGEVLVSQFKILAIKSNIFKFKSKGETTI